MPRFGRSHQEPEKKTRIGCARTPEAPKPAGDTEEEYGLFELWPDTSPGEATKVPTMMESVSPSRSLGTYTEQHCRRSWAGRAPVQNMDCRQESMAPGYFAERCARGTSFYLRLQLEHRYRRHCIEY